MAQNRVPTAALDARGSFLKHPERKRSRASEPEPSGPLGDPPGALNETEKTAWCELAGIIPPGVAANSDRWAVEKLVRLMVLDRTGRASGAEQTLLTSLLSKMGMTPADRSRVSAMKKKPPADDPLSRLLGPKVQ